MLFTNLVQANLRTKYLGRNIEYYSRLSSTNDEAWELVKESASHGTIVITDNQFNGKGRYGNHWSSYPDKSLTFSIILYDFDQENMMPAIIGISVCKALKKFNFNIKLKWPNDLILSKKKIGGILCESKMLKNQKKAMAIGIGINVNETIDDIPPELHARATSLYCISNQCHQRERILAEVLNYIEKIILKKNENENFIIKEWESLCMHMNSNVSFHANDKKINGRFLSLRSNGSALMMVGDSEKEFSSGIINIHKDEKP